MDGGAHLEPMRPSFHGRWTEDQSKLHINMLEIMAICFALKRGITIIHHSCVMISMDNTTVVSYINKQGGTHSPNLCIEVWKSLRWCLEYDVIIRVRHIPGKFNILADCLSRLDRPIKTNRMGIGSDSRELHIPNAQLSQRGPFCDTIQSQTSIVCIPSSRQPCTSSRRSFNELKFTSCICISSYNSDTFYSSQDTSVSVQNSSHCSLLAPTAVVLRDATTSSVSSNSSFTISKNSDTVKRKISTPKSPITWPSRLGVIKHSVR